MEERDRHNIELKNRFVTGVVSTIPSDANVMHVQLPKQCSWAKWARITQDDLPEGKNISDYQKDEEIRIFLLKLSAGDSDFFRASVRWAEPQNNPWIIDPPIKGQLYDVKAVSYLPNMTAVFVQLPNGIDSLLRVTEVPGNYKDISDVIDIGDTLVIEVIAIHKQVLEAPVSIKKALQTLKIEEKHRRIKEFSLEMVRIIPQQQWNLPLKYEFKLALLIDRYFSQDLSAWLYSIGLETLPLNDWEHLLRILPAPNLPTHLLCDPEKWPETVSASNRLKNALHQRNIQLIWLRSEDYPSLIPIKSTELSLPIHLFDLIQLMQDKDYQPQENKQQQRFELNNYQHRHVIQLASRLLEKICLQHHFQAALWIKKMRPGVYIDHVSYNLNQAILKAIQPRLAQTLLADSIEQHEQFDWEVSKLGVLQNLAPPQSDKVICIPIPYQALNGEEHTPCKRAIAFFYRQSDHPESPSSRLEQYLPAMQALIDTLHFAEHNETLSAFAGLGLNSASYLHELGQAAIPVNDFLKQHPTPTQINKQEWNALRKNIQHLLDMAHGDLSSIQRTRKQRIRLKQRLERIADIYLYRFNRINCEFSLSLPEQPMMLSLNPLIIEQILCNLLDNALHFVQKLDSFGRVSVVVKLDKENMQLPLVIDVTDNGSGVRASMWERIFQPRDSGKSEGTGMGLFISQRYLDGIGGKLELLETSVRWRQTQFRIRLPILLNSI